MNLVYLKILPPWSNPTRVRQSSRGIATRAHFFPTSFQNSAAGLPLIVSSVLMERRIAASRSGWKSLPGLLNAI